MTTSDGQGLNWKWLSGLLISMVAGLLVIVATMALSMRNSDTSKICNLEASVSKIEKAVTKIQSDQEWTLSMIRSHLEQGNGKGNK